MIATLRNLVGGFFSLLLTCVLGAIFVHSGYTKTARALRVRSEGQPIQAHVEGWQISSTDLWPDTYQLSYRFGVNQRFYGSGVFDQWETVPYEDWVASQQTDTINVLYVAADPNLNAPSHRSALTLPWFVSEMVGGALMCLASLLAPLLLLVRRR